jgi:hypothetical protein
VLHGRSLRWRSNPDALIEWVACFRLRGSNIRTAMNGGAFDFVTKPIDFQDLQTTITKTMRHIELSGRSTVQLSRRRPVAAEPAFISKFSLAEACRQPIYLPLEMNEQVNGRADAQTQ